jgi:hypothetical protein
MKITKSNIPFFKIISLVLSCTCIILSSYCISVSFKIESDLDLLAVKIQQLKNGIDTDFSEQNDFLSSSFKVQDESDGKRNNLIKTRITSLDSTYTDLLQEQKKQHVSTVEKDTEITEEEKTAEKLFSQGKYHESSLMFGNVIVYEKNNQSARFYASYSEFLANPMDSTAYDRITREFNDLKKSGYQRKEIDSTLEFIKNETAQ